MKSTVFAILWITAFTGIYQAQSLQNRVISNDPAKYRTLSAAHAGADKMGFSQLLARTELSTNFYSSIQAVSKANQV